MSPTCSTAKPRHAADDIPPDLPPTFTTGQVLQLGVHPRRQARRQHRGTQELLTLYVLERFLARLSISTHADRFVLKGGMLLAALSARRPTADLDLMATHLANDERTVLNRITGIAGTTPEKGRRRGLPDRDATQTKAAIDATAAHRQITLRPLSQAVADLATTRAQTYTAFLRRLGPDAATSPQDFRDVVNQVIAFADALLGPHSGHRPHWSAATRSRIALPG